MDRYSEAFVSYSLFEGLGNFSTNIVKGGNPSFDYMKSHDIPQHYDVLT